MKKSHDHHIYDLNSLKNNLNFYKRPFSMFLPLIEFNIFTFNMGRNLVAERTHKAPNTTLTCDFAHISSKLRLNESLTVTSSQDGTGTEMGTQEFTDINTDTIS